jgi:hypothetical protein
MMNNNSLKEQRERLVADIDEVKGKAENRRRINSIFYSTLILMGIRLSAGAAAAGFYDEARIAGILALVAAASVTVESAFKFGDKRDFFRIIASEYNNLQIALQYRVDTEPKFQLVVDKFQIVNATLAKSVPRGKGMEATKLLYEDLDRRGVLPVPELSGTQ